MYNKRNYYLKVAEIQNEVLSYKKKGNTQKWIYDNIIKPKYCISFSTYNNYLNVPAKRELNKMFNINNLSV